MLVCIIALYTCHSVWSWFMYFYHVKKLSINSYFECLSTCSVNISGDRCLEMGFLSHRVYKHVVLLCLLAQSCPALCDPMVCSPWGFPVHGIIPARMLEWVAISSSRGSFRPRGWTPVYWVSCIGRRILYHWVTWEAHVILLYIVKFLSVGGVPFYIPTSIVRQCQFVHIPRVCCQTFMMAIFKN